MTFLAEWDIAIAAGWTFLMLALTAIRLWRSIERDVVDVAVATFVSVVAVFVFVRFSMNVPWLPWSGHPALVPIGYVLLVPSSTILCWHVHRSTRRKQS